MKVLHLLLLGSLLTAAPTAPRAAAPAPASSTAGPSELLQRARSASLEWRALSSEPTAAALYGQAEAALRTAVAAHPTDVNLRAELAEARCGLGRHAAARETLERIPVALRTATVRRRLAELAARGRVEKWAGAARGTLVSAQPLPDGRWLAVTAQATPAILGERSLDDARLSLLDAAGPKVLQTLPLIGPVNHSAEFGLFSVAPDLEPHSDHVPVLNVVDLLVRRSGSTVLVYVAQMIHGASWTPSGVQVYRYAAGRLQWTLTAGSRGRPLLRDEDGDGSAELVTFSSVGWTLSTSSPPLWEETFEWDGARWQGANSQFPERYRRLADLYSGLNEKRPNDPDTLFHLARALAALGKDAEALTRAGDALRATNEWSHPQPDAQDRADMTARVKQFFPRAVATPGRAGG